MIVIPESQPPDQNDRAKISMFLIKLLSGIYTAVMVILSLAFQLSSVSLFKLSDIDAHLHFYTYLYLTSLVYYGYCFFYILRDPKENKLLQLSKVCYKQDPTLPSESVVVEETAPKVKSSHHATPAGSMFLRMGATIFAMVAITDNLVELVALVETCNIKDNLVRALNTVVETIFIFAQAYFIVRNYRLVIRTFKNTSRFGTAHLVAVNVALFIKSVIIEELAAIHHLEEKRLRLTQQNPSNESHTSHTHSSFTEDHINCHINAKISTSLWFGGHSLIEQFCITCLVEFSIIGSAVMFILWLNLDNDSQSIELQKPRKHHVKMDCSSSTHGLFCGLAFLVITLASITLFFIKIKSSETYAMLVFYSNDLILYVFSSLAVVSIFIGMLKTEIQMVQYEKVKLLDAILLIIGLTGQSMFCVFSLIAGPWDKTSNLSILRALVLVCEIGQAMAQSVLILILQRINHKGGKKWKKQTIMFLMVINVVLWFVKTFETPEVLTTNAARGSYGKTVIWFTIIESTIPICTFFRFHSAACFVDIWKTFHQRVRQSENN